MEHTVDLNLTLSTVKTRAGSERHCGSCDAKRPRRRASACDATEPRRVVRTLPTSRSASGVREAGADGVQ
jgi:hypothetical protein